MKRTEFISFRVNPKEKIELLKFARIEDIKVSELLREIINRRIDKEKIISKK